MEGRISRQKTVAALAVALLVAPSAYAGGTQAGNAAPNPYACGGEWTTAGVCTFDYAGGALEVRGSFRAAHVGFIKVVVEAEGPAGRRVPVQWCTSQPGTAGVCTSSSGSQTIALEEGQRLFCTAIGEEHGRYSCSSRP